MLNSTINAVKCGYRLLILYSHTYLGTVSVNVHLYNTLVVLRLIKVQSYILFDPSELVIIAN